MNNLISIITPAYNAENFIAETIRSVIRQSYTSWEHIVVIDSKSNDNTEDIVRTFAQNDNRIQVIKTGNNKGVADNRNEGIRHAKGEYIAFLDADDVWNSEKLHKQLTFMKVKCSDFSCHAYQGISQDGNQKYKVRQVPEYATTSDLLVNNTIGCLTVMIKKSILPSPAFAETSHEDLALWLKISKSTPVCGLNENLAFYRIVKGSRSNNKLWAARGRWKILREVEKLTLLQSIYFFLQYAFSSISKRFGI